MNTLKLTEKELLEIDGGVVGDGHGGTCTDPYGKLLIDKLVNR